jgi:hypothetical protein
MNGAERTQRGFCPPHLGTAALKAVLRLVLHVTGARVAKPKLRPTMLTGGDMALCVQSIAFKHAETEGERRYMSLSTVHLHCLKATLAQRLTRHETHTRVKPMD